MDPRTILAQVGPHRGSGRCFPGGVPRNHTRLQGDVSEISDRAASTVLQVCYCIGLLAALHLHQEVAWRKGDFWSHRRRIAHSPSKTESRP